MIYAELSGGLGNQMFIYAFARALALRGGEGLTLLDRQDWRGSAPAHTVCGLQALNLPDTVRIIQTPQYAKTHLPRQNLMKTLMIKAEQRGGMMAQSWEGFERRMAPLCNAMGLHFATEGYIPVRRGRSRDFLAWGYFQSPRYFAGQEDAIRAELRTRQPLGGQGAAFAEKIAAAPCPVALHWRCGDYRKPENAPLQVCTPAYYAAACRAAARRWPGASLFLFSDEPEYALAHLDAAGLPVTPAPPGMPAADDLALMQRCRHFIMSNSTYSWWGQYLGDAADKTVYAPDRWYANGKAAALYQPEWVLVPTGGK